MDISNQNQILYAKFIEETIRGGQTYYRPYNIVRSCWSRQLGHIEQATQPRRYYLLSVKLAGLPALRIKLPRWASVHTMYL